MFISWLCCDRKSRAACAQSFAPWQQATIEITRRDHSTIACSRHTHIFVLRAHPVRGESHNQRNASGEVATVAIRQICIPGVESRIVFAMATQYEILAKLIPQPGLLTTACHLVAAVFADLSGTAAKR